MMAENEDLGFLIPEEGTNVWEDAMVITNDCTEVELAHAYINFMLDPDNAYANTVEVGYTSPVVEARNQAAENDYNGISAYIPDMTREQDEVFRYQDKDTKAYFAELWTKVKASN
jgi:spermidine/putrescine-binding protein